MYLGCRILNIYVYSDESGVLDKVHNNIFVFGGLVFLSKEERDVAARKYCKAEKTVREVGNYSNNVEIKASTITLKERGSLYRSLNKCYKFGAVVNQRRVLNSIMADKKSKQRFLDYVYKIALKRLLEKLIEENIINPAEVERITLYIDEHTTSTNGIYELRQSLEEEFKRGTHSHNYTKFFPPIFPQMLDVQLNYCNSSVNRLVRAADIVANRIYRNETNGIAFQSFDTKACKLLITRFP